MPSISISAIARDWGTSRPYVSRCVNHRGCPTTSLQGAREWRECYANTRAVITRHIEHQGKSDSQEGCAVIPLATAKDIACCGYDTILDLVLQLPKTVSTQCNPYNPETAFNVLEAECTAILCEACEVYSVWSKVRPHISTAANTE
jgi:hypothetical protein